MITDGDWRVGPQTLDHEKKLMQRELSTWSKKIPLIVGFETVAEALLGAKTFNFLLPKNDIVEDDHEANNLDASDWNDPEVLEESTIRDNKETDSTIANTTSSNSEKSDDEARSEDQFEGEGPLDLRKPKFGEVSNGSDLAYAVNKTRYWSSQSSIWSSRYQPGASAHDAFQSTRKVDCNHDSETSGFDRFLSPFISSMVENDLIKFQYLNHARKQQTKDHRSKSKPNLNQEWDHPKSSETSDLFVRREMSTSLLTPRHLFSTKTQKVDKNNSCVDKNNRNVASTDSKTSLHTREMKRENSIAVEETKGRCLSDPKLSGKQDVMDFGQTEKFECISLSSHEGSIPAPEETSEDSSRDAGNSMFQMNKRIEQLLMSVITKNIYEKYQYLKNCHQDQKDVHSGQLPQVSSPMDTEVGFISSPEISSAERNQDVQEDQSTLHQNKMSPYNLPFSLQRGGNALFTSRFSDSTPQIPSETPISSPPSYHPTLLGSDARCSGSQNSGIPPQSITTTQSDSNNFQSPTSSTSATVKKTRPKRGQYRRYNRQLLLDAVKAVQQGDMSVHRAGSYFGVPHSTLEYKVKERHLLRNKKSVQDQQQQRNVSNDNNDNRQGQHHNPNKSSSDLPTQNHETFSPTGTNLYPSSCVDSKSSINFVTHQEYFTPNGLPNSTDNGSSQPKKRCLVKDTTSPHLRTPSPSNFYNNNNNNFKYPFFNDAFFRGSTLPFFNSTLFDRFASAYNWLAPGFSKSFPFPLQPAAPSSIMPGSFFPPGFINPATGMDQLNPASELLKQLNFKAQTETTVPGIMPKSCGTGENAEPHSTSDGEIDLRVTKKAIEE